MINCQDDNLTFGSLGAPTSLKVTAEIVGKTTAKPNGDGSGKVNFTSTADNAISYKYIFDDGTSENSPSGIYQSHLQLLGEYLYCHCIAFGKVGVATNTTIQVTVLSDFKDEQAVQFLTGGLVKNGTGHKLKWVI
jgi:hypothetical protein